MADGRVSRAAFVFVFVTVAIDMLALGVIVPVLPGLLIEFRGGSASDGALYYGIFGSVFALMQFLFSPVLGSLSDRFGRRTVLILSNLGLGLDYLVMAIAPTIGWLFVGRVVAGITSSSYGTAGAYVADVTPPEQRAEKFGMLVSPLPSASSLVLQSVGCWPQSVCVPRSSCRRVCVWPMCCTGSSCCRNRYLPSADRRSRGATLIRSAR